MKKRMVVVAGGLALALVRCTLVVGTETRRVGDADAAVDAGTKETGTSCGVPATAACFTSARDCKSECDATESTCRAGCNGPGPKGCDDGCKKAKDACRATCFGTCRQCGTNLGCALDGDCQRALD